MMRLMRLIQIDSINIDENNQFQAAPFDLYFIHRKSSMIWIK